MLQEGVPPKPWRPEYPNRCLSGDLRDAAKEHDRYTNESAIAAKLKSIFGEDGMKAFNNKVARGWAFPPLAECRALWTGRNGGRWRWHRDVPEWGTRNGC